MVTLFASNPWRNRRRPDLRRLDSGALVEVDTILRVLGARQAVACGAEKRRGPRRSSLPSGGSRQLGDGVEIAEVGVALSRPWAARDRTLPIILIHGYAEKAAIEELANTRVVLLQTFQSRRARRDH